MVDTLASESPQSGPVLPLVLGRSAYLRLLQVAQGEGIDPTTCATNLLLFQLGVSSVFAATARAQSNGTNHVHAERADVVRQAVVCMSCARPRPSAAPARCPSCGGNWTLGAG